MQDVNQNQSRDFFGVWVAVGFKCFHRFLLVDYWLSLGGCKVRALLVSVRPIAPWD